MSTTTTDRAAARVAVFARRLRTDGVFALGVLLGLVSVGAVLQTTITALVRIRFPLALEWTEGGVVDHVHMLLTGGALYRAPSIAWTPFVHPPFYYAVCAVFMKVFGVSLLVARLVSVTSMFASFVLLAAFARREVGGVVGPLVASGLFAISFQLTGFWMDLAQVDSLFFALFLGGAYLLHGASGLHARPMHPARAVVGGVFLFLALFTKQPGLLLGVPVLAAAVASDRRSGLVATGTFLFLSIGAVQWLDLTTHNWFRYYVFEVFWTRASSGAATGWDSVFRAAVWHPMPVGLALALVVFGTTRLGVRGVVFYGGALAAAAAYAFFGIATEGAAHALIPYCGILAILVGIFVGRVSTAPPPRPTAHIPHAGGTPGLDASVETAPPSIPHPGDVAAVDPEAPAANSLPSGARGLGTAVAPAAPASLPSPSGTPGLGVSVDHAAPAGIPSRGPLAVGVAFENGPSRVRGLALGLVLLQFLMLAYDQRPSVPRGRDFRTAHAVLARWHVLREKGPVLSFAFGHYGHVAGDTSSEGLNAHTKALVDVLHTGASGPAAALTDELRALPHARHYRSFVRDESLSLLPPLFDEVLTTAYRPDGHLFGPTESGHAWPRTGPRTRPNDISTLR